MNKKIKSILRCYAAGMGIKETADTFHMASHIELSYQLNFNTLQKNIA